MTNEQKERIVAELHKICKKDTQKKTAMRAGVSEGTISQMRNNNWALISSEMWRKVQVSLRIDFGWNTANTFNFKMLQLLLRNAKSESISVAVAHNAGAGKSHSYRYFERTTENVIYIECKTFWTRKCYMQNICIACGLDSSGKVDELVERFITYIQGLHQPMVIIDQLDKLNNGSLDLFMDFYNDLDGFCGFLVSGVPALKKRILRGCQSDKTGYQEFYSRIGKSFIHLNKMTEQDVALICQSNGIDDAQFINHTFNICDDDVRKVRREIDKFFLANKKAA